MTPPVANSHPMDFLLDEELNFPVAGEVRSGYIVSRSNNEILVDIGAKSEGVIDSREISSFDSDTLAKLEVGNEIQVYVVNPEDGNGSIVLSYSKAAEVEDWERAVENLESQEVMTCQVLALTAAACLVGVGLLRGFVPNSQLSREPADQPRRSDREAACTAEPDRRNAERQGY